VAAVVVVVVVVGYPIALINWCGYKICFCFSLWISCG
jgi:hypothetical protein